MSDWVTENSKQEAADILAATETLILCIERLKKELDGRNPQRRIDGLLRRTLLATFDDKAQMQSTREG